MTSEEVVAIINDKLNRQREELESKLTEVNGQLRALRQEIERADAEGCGEGDSLCAESLSQLAQVTIRRVGQRDVLESERQDAEAELKRLVADRIEKWNENDQMRVCAQLIAKDILPTLRQRIPSDLKADGGLTVVPGCRKRAAVWLQAREMLDLLGFQVGFKDANQVLHHVHTSHPISCTLEFSFPVKQEPPSDQTDSFGDPVHPWRK